MKKSVLALLLLCTFWSSAQELGVIPRFKVLRDSDFLERLMVNPTLPDLEVTTMAGEKSTLLKQIAKNRKFKTKPVLLMSTYTFCSGCFDIFNTLADSGLSDQYDVIVVVELMKKEQEGGKIKEFLEKSSVIKVTENYNTVFADQDKFGRLYNTAATPLFMVADAQLRPYYTLISLQGKLAATRVKEALSLGANGLAGRDKTWLDQDLLPVAQSNPAAFYYYSMREQGARTIFTMGGKDYLQKEESFLITEDSLIRDGKSVNNNVTVSEDGKAKQSLYAEVMYNMGRPAQAYKAYYADGKLAEDYPLNGTYKAYDETRNLTAEGPIKDGLGEGVFIYYKDRKETGRLNYKKGKRVE